MIAKGGEENRTLSGGHGSDSDYAKHSSPTALQCGSQTDAVADIRRLRNIRLSCRKPDARCEVAADVIKAVADPARRVARNLLKE